MSFRPLLIGQAPSQFSDLANDQAVYDAFMDRLVELAEAPWDAWPIYPGGHEPEFRQTPFGDHGLLSFRVDEQAETLIIFSILWAG